MIYFTYANICSRFALTIINLDSKPSEKEYIKISKGVCSIEKEKTKKSSESSYQQYNAGGPTCKRWF